MAQYEKTGGNILGIFAKFVSSPNNATKQKGKADAFETSDDWGGKIPKAAIWNLQAEDSGLRPSVRDGHDNTASLTAPCLWLARG